MLATTFALLFPVLLIGGTLLLLFLSWQAALLSIVFAVICFKASRHLTKEDVGKDALTEPKLLGLLMQRGVVWFEMEEQRNDLP